VPPKNAPIVAAKAEPVRTATLVAPSQESQEEALVQTLASVAPVEAATPAAEPAPMTPGILGKLPAMMAAAKEVALPSAKADLAPAPKQEASLIRKTEVPSPRKVEEHFPTAPRITRGGWAIQVGAYEDEGEAKQHLTSAKSKIAQAVQKAEAYIERTVKGAKTYYRARFAGFDRDQAESVCKRLKREDVACMALKI